MAAARQYTPARRWMMQLVMWLILGATVAVAALITAHRQHQFEVKLNKSFTSGQLTIQLPGNWEMHATSNPLSPTLVSMVEPANDEDQAPRVIRIIRAPLPVHQTPLEFATLQMPMDEKLTRDGDIENIDIAGSPGVMLAVVVQNQNQTDSSDENVGKMIVAAAVPPSGRGVAVVLYGEGVPDSSDLDLVKRIAQSIKLSDEPATTRESQLWHSGPRLGHFSGHVWHLFSTVFSGH